MTDFPSRALISRSAFMHNIDVCKSRTQAKMMAIVKADGYGHGAVQCAAWAWEAGIEWLGLAQVAEAVQLREHHPHGHILSWIYPPGSDLVTPIERNIDLSLGAPWTIDEVAAAARACGKTARVHIKVDTGMSRGGFDIDQLPAVLPLIKQLTDDGVFDVVGLWSHLVRGDEIDEENYTGVQIERFERARTLVAEAGIEPELTHLGASAGLLWHPQTHYDMLRVGIALYGFSPNPVVETAEEIGLRGVMQVEADLIVTRDVPAGTGVAYGHTYVTDHPTRLGVVPVGYADGITRAASNRCDVTLNGTQAPIRGVVCMDQFVVECPGAKAGDTAVLFGDTAKGYTSGDVWADVAGTINFEIICKIGSRIPRIYVD